MTTKEQHEQKLQAQLDEWKAEIDKLKAKASSKQIDAKVEYDKEIEKLTYMKNSVEDKFKKFQESSNEAWEDINVGLHDALNSLDNAFKSAKSRLK